MEGWGAANREQTFTAAGGEGAAGRLNTSLPAAAGAAVRLAKLQGSEAGKFAAQFLPGRAASADQVPPARRGGG